MSIRSMDSHTLTRLRARIIHCVICQKSVFMDRTGPASSTGTPIIGPVQRRKLHTDLAKL